MRAALLGLAFTVFTSAAAFAQAYPDRPLKLIVADGPGSISDTRARQVATRLGAALGQPVVVDNRPGGSMMIAAEAAARSAPDGYTLFLGNVVTHSLNPLLFKSLPYRPEDFAPVTMISAGPLVLVVHPDVPARTLEELIALGKSQPDKYDYGAIGAGSPSHLIMEQLKAARGARFNFVPYKATASYLQDLVGGHLHVTLNYWALLGGQVKAGKLRALAVAAATRLSAAPEIPTFAEAGVPGIEGSSWQGIMVPAGTPRPIVLRLHLELARVLASPEIRSSIEDQGSNAGGNSPEDFAAFIQADRERWRKAAESAKVERM